MATMRQLSVWTRSCEVSVAAAVYDCLGEQASGLWSIGNASQNFWVKKQNIGKMAPKMEMVIGSHDNNEEPRPLP